MKGYTEKQTKKLVDMAAEAERSGKSLTKVFSQFAAETGRASGSVRNYYYQLIKTAKSDEDVMNKYPAIKGISVNKNVGFTELEEQNLYAEVERGVSLGKSVRSTIKELSGGDEKLALRYQNKYRNMRRSAKGRPVYEGDRAYRELANKINGLVDRIGKNLRSENQRLKEKVQFLSSENKRLKKQVAASMVAEYFSLNDSAKPNEL